MHDRDSDSPEAKPKTEGLPATSPSDIPADQAQTEGPVGRRKFLAGLAGAAGAAGAAVVGGQALQASEVKQKILSRIQEEIERDHVEDPFAHDKGTVVHEKYTKQGGSS